MRVQALVPALTLVLVLSESLFAQRDSAPETFTANAHVQGASAGAGAATIEVHIKRYTPDAERTAVEDALKTGGFQGLSPLSAKRRRSGM
jgi:hypothetical protein